MSKPYQDADWLRQKYHDEGLQQSEMAEMCGVSNTTIIRWMQRHSIETRSAEDYHPEQKYQDAEWLRKKYHDEGLSQREVAAECDSTVGTIHRWMVRLGVELRTKSEALSGERSPFWGTTREFSDEHKENMSKCRMGEKHHQYGKPLSEEHRRKISEAHKDREQTESQLDNLREYHEYVSEHGMPEHHRQALRESHLSGEHPLSTGGYFGYDSKAWFRARDAACERAEYTCEAPGCSVSSEDLSTNPDVHHIIPARHFDDSRIAHDLDNLLVLCPAHHRELDALIQYTERKHASIQRDTIPDKAVGQARIRDF